MDTKKNKHIIVVKKIQDTIETINGGNGMDTTETNTNATSKHITNNNIEQDTELFMNPAKFKKIKEQKHNSEERNTHIYEDTNIQYSKEDYKFYKKRLFQLFKDIINKKNNDENVMGAFHIFIHNGIEYLKFQDKSDILQQDYRENIRVHFQEVKEFRETQKTHTEKIDTRKDNNKDEDTEAFLYKTTSSYLMGQNTQQHTQLTSQPRNIEDVLHIEKRTHKHLEKKKPEYVIPKKKEINLKDETLRMKGVSDKNKKKQPKSCLKKRVKEGVSVVVEQDDSVANTNASTNTHANEKQNTKNEKNIQ